MPHSNYARQCVCGEIVEPVTKTRNQFDDELLASYRCTNCDLTFFREFTVDEPPEPIPEPEEVDKPPAPEGNVMDWSDEDRDKFIQFYGEDKWRKLIEKAVKNDGEAYYVRPADEPAMPTADNPLEWSENQVNNFVKKYGREKYQQRLSDHFFSQDEES